MNKKQDIFIHQIRENQGIILKVVNMYCEQDEDREDLFQEIVYQLWRAYESYEGRSKFSSWMYQVAINTAISSLRKRKRKAPLQSISEKEMQLQDKVKPIDYTEEKKVLYKAIERLSAVEKAIVMLYLEEHAYEEIAGIMGITKTLVGVKLNRIKKKLRKMMIPYFS